MRSHKKIILKIFFLFSFLLGSFIFLGIFGSVNSAQAALTCQVRNGACVGAEIALLRMSDAVNAHAGLEGSSVYSHRICCEDDAGVVTISNNCLAPINDTFLHLLASDNAHVDSLGGYANDACISVNSGAISCSYQNGACATGACLASISANTNAHIGDCVAYPRKVCCEFSIPLTCTLALDFTSIVVGDSATLIWVTTGATGVDINTVPEALSDSKIVTPVVTTTYDLVATDGVNSVTCSETLTVTAPLPVCDSFTASPSSIISGNSSTLTWATTDAVSVSINGVGKALDGNEIVSPIANTVYTLTADNADGDSVICSTTVTIIPPPSSPDGHMKLNYFDKDIVAVFNDASLFLLGIVGKLVLLFLIFGGVYYIMSGADPKKQENAKKIITYALLGLVFVLISYAVIVALDRIGAL